MAPVFRQFLSNREIFTHLLHKKGSWMHKPEVILKAIVEAAQ